MAKTWYDIPILNQLKKRLIRTFERIFLKSTSNLFPVSEGMQLVSSGPNFNQSLKASIIILNHIQLILMID